MIKKSTWLHLRIPFSYFLLPVYFFSLSVIPELNFWDVVISFLAIHLFLYPASNGYNSYFDKDEESIGGLENPPPVDKELYSTALIFDLIAILVAFVGSWKFAIALFIYGLVSKAYSHDKIRLKKFPVISWIVVSFFQGSFIFLSVYQLFTGGNWGEIFQNPGIIIPALLSTAMLMGSYPMTQVYQHEEDGKRGDLTISRMLGIRGTFIFTMVFFSLAMGGFAWFYINWFDEIYAIGLFVALFPVLVYFLYWFWQVYKNPLKADFKSTMKLNFISATCFNLFFFSTILARHLA